MIHEKTFKSNKYSICHRSQSFHPVQSSSIPMVSIVFAFSSSPLLLVKSPLPFFEFLAGPDLLFLLFAVLADRFLFFFS